MEIDLDHPISSQRSVFLDNSKNTQNFVDLLTTYLKGYGISVLQAEADADVDIVQEAIDLARESVVTAIVEDTDICNCDADS